MTNNVDESVEDIIRRIVETAEDLDNPPCTFQKAVHEHPCWVELNQNHSVGEHVCGLAMSCLIEEIGISWNGTSPKTYATSLRIFTKYLHNKRGTTTLNANIRDIDKFFKDRKKDKLSKSRFKVDRAAVKKLYDHIIWDLRLETNVTVREIERRCTNKRYNFRQSIEGKHLELDQAVSIMNKLSYCDKLVTQVGIETGKRREDLCSIKIDDVDLENNIILMKDTKSHQEQAEHRKVERSITKYLSYLLKRWINVDRNEYTDDPDNEYLFPGETGYLNPNGFYKRFIDATEQSGIQRTIFSREATEAEKEMGKDSYERNKFNVHSLRHTFGHLLYDELGAEKEEIQRALEHEDLGTTEIYLPDTKLTYGEVLDDIYDDEISGRG